mmetsp:Transcript_24448/g.78918  ORF Transcript_24448/g.78918 Transcript_24448/m.78918 type:complete len:293 (-) Transcript_24448:209-1087(-)
MLVHKRSLFASSPPRLSRQGRQVLLEALHKAGEVVGRDVEVVQPLVLVVDEERHQVDRTRVDGIRSCHDGTAACEVLLERVGVETALCRLVARAPLVAAQLVGDAGLGARQRIEDHVARQGRDLPRVEFGRGAADRGSEGVRAEGQSADILLVPVPLRLRLPLAEPTPLRRPGRPRLGAGLLDVGRGELRVIFWPAGQLGGASLAAEPRRLAREGLLPARPRVAQRRAVHDVALRVEEGVHCGEFPYAVPLLHPLPSTENVDDINGRHFGSGCEEVGSPAKGAGGGSRCTRR